MSDVEVQESESPALEPLGPRKVLVDWANGQDGWARTLVAEVLVTGRPVAQDKLDEIYELFKTEKGLSPAQAEEVPPLATPEGGAEEEEPLLLVKLKDVQGVNALAEGHEIDFNPHMTVLFGENGAGKTGYARVLKCAAGVRTAEDILPNAHATTAAPEPSATISYKLGDEDPEEVGWQNERGLSPFTRISVFDAPAVLLHVDNELGYVYTPADLALFKHCSDAIRGIADLAAAEVGRHRLTVNPFLPRFSRGTSIYPLIESLSAATSVDDLKAAAGKPNGNAAKRLDQLRSEIAALGGNTLEEKLFAARTRQSSLRDLIGLVAQVSEINAGAYNTALSALESAQSEYRRARTELFKEGDLHGEADDEWQTFIAAAEEYRKHLGEDDYPHEADRCLYCRQVLDKSGVSVIQRYRSFLDDSLARQVTQAQERLTSQLPSFDEASVIEPKALVERLGLIDPPPSWLDEARKVIENAELIAKTCGKRSALAEADLQGGAGELSPQLEEARAAEAKTIEDIEQQTKDRAKALETRQKELAELEARLELHKQLPAILSSIEDAKFAAKLDTVGKRISNTTLRSLTEASKVASEELVNHNFENFFEEECRLLRAPSVQLEFQGRGGRAERRKAVARHRPSAILSEGEVKCLAIADFLAECRLRGACAPMIFDDPVTSLDYRRLKEVANRLVLLAETHQVIVFTHNIWLTTELLSRYEDKKTECTYYTVRDQDDVKGLVSHEAGPRQDSPAQLGKRINELLNTGKKAEPTVQEALAEKGYEYIRSWCEAFVEQELLEKVTQRYQPNVMMTRLSNIKADFIPEAQAVIDPIFEKACRFMGGHSQPLEQLNIRPSLSELETDWEALQDLRTKW